MGTFMPGSIVCWIMAIFSEEFYVYGLLPNRIPVIPKLALVLDIYSSPSLLYGDTATVRCFRGLHHFIQLKRFIHDLKNMSLGQLTISKSAIDG
jgi:hypothetical protein